MATAWPEKRRLIGKKHTRLDGPAKSTGKAKYSFDINRPGMLHAVILRSPQAHCKIKTLDTADAEKLPGVKAVFVIKDKGSELFYVGDEILGLAADTEEHAHDAVRAIKIEFDPLPALVKEEDALKNDLKTVPPVGPQQERQNVRPPQDQKTGNIDEGFKAAEATVEGEYGMATICHQCLESHGLVAEWDADGKGLTVWASTQAVTGTAAGLGGYFRAKKVDLPDSKVKCITQYMGGGFGSKFGADVQGNCCAELALKAKAPVKLMLDRASEIIAAGNRPSAYGKVKIGGKKDGTITAFEIDSFGTPGIGNGATVGPLPYVYAIPNSARKHTIVRLNAGAQRAMRAPGHPQSCFLTESAVDDFAAKIGMDPMEVRLKNLPPKLPQAAAGDQNAGGVYAKEIEIIAGLCEWKKKWKAPGSDKGVLKHGIGMALHTWGGQAAPQPNDCKVTIAADGSVTAETSTQDLGTAQRTVTAIVVAEILGLNTGDITLKFGESFYGRSSGSGGSTTCPSQAPAALRGASAARDDFFDKLAAKLKVDATDLAIEPGKVIDKKNNKTLEWKKACAMLGMDTATGLGTWTAGDANKPDSKNVSSVGVGGCQVAEVVVDTETGVVRCTTIYAVQDCGLIVNLQGCESQVAGGVIMGFNYALFEERIMDRATGRQVNPDMEFYKLAGMKDIPKVVVKMYDMPERGVIGIGEPPTISTHAAIGNAVFNALGVRVPTTPFTPDKVLAALAAKGGQ
jgi:xanthine dehydrogenase YagR molybdenum-binding subunit